jgi:L-alanine-DL-glutamate epimerase-like enolase superfamily enzyme
MKVNYYKFNLPFRYPFTISRGTKTHQPTLIVELEHFGIKGYGEAPSIKYYDITVEQMIEQLEAKKLLLKSLLLQNLNVTGITCIILYPIIPFLFVLLDIAAWDLYGKMKGKPLYKLWNLDISNNPSLIIQLVLIRSIRW